jgi:hypothetical protein
MVERSPFAVRLLVGVAVLFVLVLSGCDSGDQLVADCGPRGVQSFRVVQGVSFTVCNDGAVFRG